MKTAIVTSYYQQPREILERCIESVRAQRVYATHILVADGAPVDWIDEVPGVRHIRLDRPHETHPLAPVAIGAALAAGEDFEAIGFVDVDTTIDDDYTETCSTIAAREYQLHFVLAESYPADAQATGGLTDAQDDALRSSAGSLFVLRRGYPALPGMALIPHPLAALGLRLLLEKFRILEYHGVATDHPLVYLPGQSIEEPHVSGAELHAWWNGLTDRERALLERQMGGTISFATS